MTGLIIAIIILVVLIGALGWLAYGFTIKVLGDRDRERAQYKKALELEQARGGELLELVHKEYQSQLDAIKEKGDQAYAVGKNEGKRAALDWIQENVNAGSLEVKVVGTLSRQPEEPVVPVAPEAPAPVAQPAPFNPFGTPQQ